jgi:hypothetical protein
LFIQHALQETGLSGQDIRGILRPPEWDGLNSRNEQMLFLSDFVGSNCDIGLSNQLLARIFGITPHQMSKVRSKARKPQTPTALSSLTKPKKNPSSSLSKTDSRHFGMSPSLRGYARPVRYMTRKEE